MKYYGIKTPEYDNAKSTILLITHNMNDSWQLFFDSYTHKAPLSEAIRAYEAIGYKCVEIEITEKS